MGSANAQEAVLAINVRMSSDSAEEHCSFVTQLSLKLTYLQCTLAPNFKAECCQYTKAMQRPHHTPSMAD